MPHLARELYKFFNRYLDGRWRKMLPMPPSWRWKLVGSGCVAALLVLGFYRPARIEPSSQVLEVKKSASTSPPLRSLPADSDPAPLLFEHIRRTRSVSFETIEVDRGTKEAP